jgi:NitT/TauT family transport system permease protein
MTVQVSRPLASRLKKNLLYYLPTLSIAVGVLVIWELFIIIFRVEQFLLPRPSAIIADFLNEIRLFLDPNTTSLLFHSTGATFLSALGGFVIGCGAGVLVALVTARWTIISEAVMPFAIAANSVPIVALAPIMNNWFGMTHPLSKMAIVAIIVFFPTMINTVRGLTLVPPRQLELMHSYAANPFKILFALRIPNALPYIFSALRVASALCVIGAVVGEFFGGPRATLGVLITQRAASFNFVQAWSAIVMASIIGMLFYALVIIAERLIMPWDVSFRNPDG